MTPRLRPHAEQITNDHLLWRSRDWRFAGKESARLRNNPAMQLAVLGLHHDIKHSVFEPPRVPSPTTCNIMHELTMSEPFTDQLDRVCNIGRAALAVAEGEPSPERADQLAELAIHITAQAQFYKVLRGEL